MSPKQKKYEDLIKEEQTIGTGGSDDDELGQWSVLVSYPEDLVDEGAAVIPIVVEIVEGKFASGVVQDIPIWYYNNAPAYYSIVEQCKMFLKKDIPERLKYAIQNWKEYPMRLEPYSSDNKAKVVGARNYAVTQLMTWVPAFKPKTEKAKSAAIKKTKDFMDEVANAFAAAIIHTVLKKGKKEPEFWVHYEEKSSFSLSARLKKDNVDPKKILNLVGKVGKFKTLDNYFLDDEIKIILATAFQDNNILNNPEVKKLGWRALE